MHTGRTGWWCRIGQGSLTVLLAGTALMLGGVGCNPAPGEQSTATGSPAVSDAQDAPSETPPGVSTTPTIGEVDPFVYLPGILEFLGALGYQPIPDPPTFSRTGDGQVLIGQTAYCPQEVTGHCQLIAFFLNDRYVGASDGTRTMRDLRSLPGGVIAADFPDFSDGSPFCCPVLWNTTVFSVENGRLRTATGPAQPSAQATPATPPTVGPEDEIERMLAEGEFDSALILAGIQLGQPLRGADIKSGLPVVWAAYTMDSVQAEPPILRGALFIRSVRMYLNDGLTSAYLNESMDRFSDAPQARAWEEKVGHEAVWYLLTAIRRRQLGPDATAVFFGDSAQSPQWLGKVSAYESATYGMADRPSLLRFLLDSGN